MAFGNRLQLKNHLPHQLWIDSLHLNLDQSQLQSLRQLQSPIQFERQSQVQNQIQFERQSQLQSPIQFESQSQLQSL